MRRFCLATAAGKIANFDPQKVALKIIFGLDFRKKIYKTKPALPNNFSFGPKGF